MNVKELTHSQQQPQVPNAHKKKPTIRLTTRVTMLWAPKGPFFTGSWSWMKLSAKHTLITEKIQSGSTRSQSHTMLAKDSFLGSLLVLPVELWNGIAG